MTTFQPILLLTTLLSTHAPFLQVQPLLPFLTCFYSEYCYQFLSTNLFPRHFFSPLPPYFILTEPSHPVTHHHVHVPHEAPESSGLILGHIQDGGKEVAHALNIAKVEVVHHIGHEDVMQQGDIGVVLSLEEWVVAVCAVDILLCL